MFLMGVSDVINGGGLAWNSAVKQNIPLFYEHSRVQIIEKLSELQISCWTCITEFSVQVKWKVVRRGKNVVGSFMVSPHHGDMLWKQLFKLQDNIIDFRGTRAAVYIIAKKN